MSKVKLTTITPVHIGNGNVLHNNIDFVQGTIDGNPYLGIVDHQKLFKVIGPDRVDSWVAAIERGENMRDFVEKYAKEDISLEGYTSRQLYCPQSLHMEQNEEMREFIHNGLGKAYIPGSSLKGAIRTAVLSRLVEQQDAAHVHFIDQPDGKVKVQNNVEKIHFGKDPNSDCFRFLQVGDAYFDEFCEDVLNMTNINVRERKSFADSSEHQLFEVITPETSSHTFNLKIVSNEVLDKMIESYNAKIIALDRGNPNRPKNPIKQFCVADLGSLFQMINEHTKELLDSEIDIWNGYIEEEGVRGYIAALKSVLLEVTKCKKDECILRVGHASGWRFITGAWTELHLDDEKWNKLVDEARPNNFRYQGMMFPKSRRVNNEKNHEEAILGFVKLQIVEP